MSRPWRRPNVIYADPPWQFNNVKTGGSMTSGSAHQYEGRTLSVKELTLLPISLVVGNPAVLALWSTTAMKPEAMEVMDAWGFTYKTTIYWIKDYGGRRLGMGAWTRGGVEELLIGIRGRVPAWQLQQPSWIRHPVLEHSRKPALFRTLIRRATKNMPDVWRVELFACRTATHWISLGDAISGRDIRDELKNWVTHVETKD